MVEGPYRGWYAPEGAAANSELDIKLLNSLTDRKEVFVPSNGPNSRKLTWYSCGPTVYDSAHMGHSRNYVTIDILRRVLEDYFGYSILFVMNITDVDDKIVLRARRNYLLKKYEEKATDVSQVKADADTSVAMCITKQQEAAKAVEQQIQQVAKEAELQSSPNANGTDNNMQLNERNQTTNPDQHQKKKLKQKAALEESLKAEQHKLTTLLGIQAKLQKVYPSAKVAAEAGDVSAGVQALLAIAGDQIALWQDSLYKSTVTDEQIFRKHAARFEKEFWRDMELLGTRRPTVLTRVTEYMPQIVAYISQIMANGFAYAAPEPESSADSQPAASGTSPNGSAPHASVYFDTAAFE